MQKVVFIAGGNWQKPFVKYLKDKGLFVAVVNPVETGTTALADYHIKADVNDLEEINKHIESLKPSFITSDQSDVSTLTVAKLSEKWKLPGNSVAAIDKLTNKFSMYAFGRQIGMPVPETAQVYCSEDVKSFAYQHNYPVIIKPVDSTMSRGFHKIDSPDDINEELFLYSKKFSKSGGVIAQTFIAGDMITLEGVCSGCKHKTVAASIKSEADYFKPGITSGVSYPSTLEPDLLEKIIAMNDRYVEDAGMVFGLTHSEYIVQGRTFHLIEIGGRGGGAGITDKIVPWVSGINTYDVLYSSLMGNVVDVKNLTVLRRPAMLKYYHIDEVANCNEQKVEAILKTPGVAAFYFDFIGKQYVSDNKDTRHTMGIYLADTYAEINVIMNKVQEIIQSQK